MSNFLHPSREIRDAIISRVIDRDNKSKIEHLRTETDLDNIIFNSNPDIFKVTHREMHGVIADRIAHQDRDHAVRTLQKSLNIMGKKEPGFRSLSIDGIFDYHTQETYRKITKITQNTDGSNNKKKLLLFRNIYIDQVVFHWIDLVQKEPEYLPQLGHWYRRKIDFNFDYGGLNKLKGK